MKSIIATLIIASVALLSFIWIASWQELVLLLYGELGRSVVFGILTSSAGSSVSSQGD